MPSTSPQGEAARADGTGEGGPADLAGGGPFAACRAERTMVLDGEHRAPRRRRVERLRVHHRVDVENVGAQVAEERLERDRTVRPRVESVHRVDRRRESGRATVVRAGHDVHLVAEFGQRPRHRQEMAMCTAAIGEPIGQVDDPHVEIMA